jgi:hypothetical protein
MQQLGVVVGYSGAPLTNAAYLYPTIRQSKQTAMQQLGVVVDRHTTVATREELSSKAAQQLI